MATKELKLDIDFTKREGTGTGISRRLRLNNQVPAVLYGADFAEGLAGSVDLKAFTPIVRDGHWETRVVTLNLGGDQETHALIRDIQRHPLSQAILHVDFYQVVKGHKVRVEVPIELLNVDSAKGVKEGGIVEFETRFVEMEVLPRLIPEKIEFDVKNLEVGAEVLIKDLALPEDTEVITDLELPVLHIVLPKVEEESDEDEETEVEVITEKKDSAE